LGIAWKTVVLTGAVLVAVTAGNNGSSRQGNEGSPAVGALSGMLKWQRCLTRARVSVA